MVIELGAILMAAVALATGITSAVTTKRENEKNREESRQILAMQNAFNAEEAEKANQRERENYLELQSPAAKLEQTKAAGLSPSLMYSGSGISGGLSAAPQANAANVQPYYSNAGSLGSIIQAISGQVGDALKAGTEAKKTSSETEKVEKETEKIEKETEKIEKEIENTQNESALSGWKYSKTMNVSYSQLKAWSAGETTSWNVAAGENNANSWGADGGVNVQVFGAKGGYNESNAQGSSSSAGSSYQKASSEELSQSGSVSVLLVPKVEDGKIKGIDVFILSSKFDQKAIEEFNEKKEKEEKKKGSTKQEAKKDADFAGSKFKENYKKRIFSEK